jgi:hypothetical protein
MSGQVEIEHCGRTVAADLVAFAIRWSGELPDHEVTWSVRVTSEDGREHVELGYARTSGGASQFALDAATGRRQEVAEDADLDDHEITVRFPADVVGVAIEWPTWQAVISVAGQDAAALAVPVS